MSEARMRTPEDFACWIVDRFNSATRGEDSPVSSTDLAALLTAWRDECVEAAADRAVKFYDLGFAPGQEAELRSAIIGQSPAMRSEATAGEIDAETMERLAANEHDRWAGQALTALHNMTEERRGRWERLAKTPYADLTEEMKELDRMQVREYLALLSRAPRAESDQIQALRDLVDQRLSRAIDAEAERDRLREENEALRVELGDEHRGVFGGCWGETPEQHARLHPECHICSMVRTKGGES